jgi:hypothetical protein
MEHETKHFTPCLQQKMRCHPEERLSPNRRSIGRRDEGSQPHESCYHCRPEQARGCPHMPSLHVGSWVSPPRVTEHETRATGHDSRGCPRFRFVEPGLAVAFPSFFISSLLLFSEPSVPLRPISLFLTTNGLRLSSPLHCTLPPIKRTFFSSAAQHTPSHTLQFPRFFIHSHHSQPFPIMAIPLQ